jgi:hypothetical protein
VTVANEGYWEWRGKQAGWLWFCNGCPGSPLGKSGLVARCKCGDVRPIGERPVSAPKQPPTTTGGLWRNNPETPDGKYLIQRRDGTVPEWPAFVLGARDPAAPAALRAYADECELLGRDPKYVADVRAMASDFYAYRREHGESDPAEKCYRTDDPATVARMREGRSA